MTNSARNHTHRFKRWIVGIVALILIGVILFPSTFVIKTVSSLVCPGAVFEVKTGQNLVALTIDDGPNIDAIDNSTDKILDVLADHDAKATFFLISSKLQKRESEALQLDPLIQRMVQDGHELGNHLLRDEPSINLGDQFEPDLIEAKTTLDRYAPQSWMRPGVGFCSNQMRKIAETNGYQTALGSTFPYDTAIPWPGFASWFITNPLTLRDGGIIVLHDDAQRGERTAQTLQKVLPILQQDKGYKVVTLSELLSADNVSIVSSQLPFGQGLLNLIREPLIIELPFSQLILVIGWLIALIVMLAFGFKSKFIEWKLSHKLLGKSSRNAFTNPFIGEALRIFFVPAMVEEVFIRGILQRWVIETQTSWIQLLLSLFLGVVFFAAYHPLIFGPLIDFFNERRKKGGKSFYQNTFRDNRFLVLVSLLGIVCTLTYLRVQTIWPCILFHWVVVVFWIVFLGGEEKLNGEEVACDQQLRGEG